MANTNCPSAFLVGSGCRTEGFASTYISIVPQHVHRNILQEEHVELVRGVIQVWIEMKEEVAQR